MPDRRPLIGPRRQVWPGPGVTEEKKREQVQLASVNAAALRDRHPLTAPVPPSVPEWIPIGPSAVLDIEHRYVVGGRVVDLAVSDDGTRAYAVTPRGGVWFTGDAGAHWVPLRGWGYQRNHEVASGLACGSLLVYFGASAAEDFVMVGTGDPSSDDSSTEPYRWGVGILWATGPAVQGGWMDDRMDLQPGQAAPAPYYLPIPRLARHPDAYPQLFSPTTVDGTLRQEDRVVAMLGPLTVYLGTWNEESTFAWQAILPHTVLPVLNGVSAAVRDIAWLRGGTGRDGRVVVAPSFGPLLYSDDAGLTWATMDWPGLRGERVMFAVADQTRLYILGRRVEAPQDPVVWRMPEPPGTELDEVGTMPEVVEPRVDGAASYESLVITVHPEPTGDDLLLLASGATGLDASLWAYRTPAVGTPGYLPATELTGLATAAPMAGFIGAGVYPRVRAIQVVGSGSQVWLATDGGVFVSVDHGRRRTFGARSVGLAAIDPTFLASHPTSSQYVALGAKHTGVLVRSGDAVWSEMDSAEGGGVAFNPVPPFSLVGQRAFADWSSQARLFRAPATRVLPRSERLQDRESQASAIYSGAAVIATSPTGSRLAIGTNRVWISDLLDVGATIWKALPYTLPGESPADAEDVRPVGTRQSDPKPDFGVPHGGALAPADDQGRGPFGPVVTIRWVSPTELLALFSESLVRWTQTADGRWTSNLLLMPGHQTRQFTDVCPVPGGGFYLTAREFDDSPDVDTCTFFDATGPHPTGLRVPPPQVPDPAFSVVIDPVYPDRVYVGTFTGVWGSVRTGTTHGPWSLVGRGLPTAAVQDLGIWVDPVDNPQHPERRLRLLRAATQARGAWEFELSDTRPARTYLRVHSADDRRRLPSPLAALRPDPLGGDDEAVLSSPDIVLRPRFGATITFPGMAPWVREVIDASNARNHAYHIWAAQTALRWLYPQVATDGRWSPGFVAALHAFADRSGVTLTADELPRPLFEAIVTGIRLPFDPANPAATPADPTSLPPAVFRPPWHTRADPGACATEVDIRQSVVPQDLTEYGTWWLYGPLWTVEVLIHHRSTDPLGALGAFCVVLWRSVTPVESAMALSADGLAQYARAVAGAPNPATVPEPAGWGWNVLRAGANPLHRLPVPLEASMPRAVSVDADFTTADWSVLIVAIAGSLTGSAPPLATVSSADQLTLPEPPAGTNVGDFVRQWPYAAARVVRLAPG